MKQRKATTARSRKLIPKQLLLPAEHGSWAWLLVPFGVGLGIAGQSNLSVLLVFVAGLAAFLMRQPAVMWLRVRQKRAPQAYGPKAVSWLVGLGLVSILCLGILISLGRVALLWLVPPIAALFGISLVFSTRGGANQRSFLLELLGAAGLAAMAPAAIIAANGHLDMLPWLVWGLMSGQNMLGVIYVRLRINDTHRRKSNRVLVLGSHLIWVTALIYATGRGIIPLLSIMPYIFFLIRAGWACARLRPVSNIKRFGFTEVGLEIVAGLIIIISFW